MSVYTVVDAYDRLVAQGLFRVAPALGLFVRRRADAWPRRPRRWGAQFSFDSMWYMQRIFENRAAPQTRLRLVAGDWLFSEGVRRSLRALAAEDTDLGGYGEPKGYLPLRQLVRDLLAEHEVVAQRRAGAADPGFQRGHGLVARHLVRPGDPVLVDEPGYANLLSSLRFLGARLVGAPHAPGLRPRCFEARVQEHRPKVFSPSPGCKAPRALTAQVAHLYRLLQLAEKYDFVVVENDIYADLDPSHGPRWPAWTSCAAWCTSAAFQDHLAQHSRGLPGPRSPTCWRSWGG